MFQRILPLLLLTALHSRLFAETLILQEGRQQGTIASQDDKVVSVLTKDGRTIRIPRTEILLIYDDSGNTLWKNPSIRAEENGTAPVDTPAMDEAGNRLAPKRNYKGYHIGGTIGWGLSYGNATFSKYPLATAPDYRTVTEFNANGAWYWDNKNALTAALGFAARTLPFASNIGNGYWLMQYIDLRGGYRWQADIIFLELGILAALPVNQPELMIETETKTTTKSVAGTHLNVFAAVSLALGLNFPITERLNALVIGRLDHAVTGAARANWPTETALDGTVASSAPLVLLPVNVTLQLGMTWRM